MTSFRANENGAARIIILGAGLAGLYAAYLLKRAGRPVLVLEARDRIGGRVDTRRTEDGMYYEMGGEWVGENDQLLRNLCKEFALPLKNHRLTTQFFHKGVHIGPGAWEPAKKLRDTIASFVARFPDLSNEEVARLQNIDWWHFLVKEGVPREDAELLDLVRSTDFGEDMRFVPAYDVLYDYVVGGDSDHGCSERIEGGSSLLAEALATRVGTEHIICSAEITSVVQTGRRVKATTRDGRVFEGVRLVAAIPTLAVSTMQWTPILPPEREAAFDELVYCRITKTALVCSKRFWKDDAFELITDRISHQIYHATQGEPGEGGVLISYATGDGAVTMARMSEAERIDELCAALQGLFGDIRPFIRSVTTYAWGDDPYTGGAYPLFERADRTTIKNLFPLPHGLVHFAGEHTARRYGFMEGAIESGARVAEEIIRAETIYS